MAETVLNTDLKEVKLFRRGKVAAKRMSKAERTARAKKAAAASATVRSAKAKAKRKKGA